MNSIVSNAIFLVMIGLPVAWVWSEFQSRRWLRIGLGTACLVMCGQMAFGLGSMGEYFNSNTWWGTASTELIDAVLRAVEEDRANELAGPLRDLRKDFEPTYETRANYDKLVKRFVARIDAAKAAKH